MKEMLCCLVTKSCPTLHYPKDYSPPGFSVHGIAQARITREGCHFLLQGIFLTLGSNLHLLRWHVDSLQLSHQGNPLKEMQSTIKQNRSP